MQINHFVKEGQSDAGLQHQLLAGILSTVICYNSSERSRDKSFS